MQHNNHEQALVCLDAEKRERRERQAKYRASEKGRAALARRKATMKARRLARRLAWTHEYRFRDGYVSTLTQVSNAARPAWIPPLGSLPLPKAVSNA